jgi:hypothetical protein
MTKKEARERFDILIASRPMGKIAQRERKGEARLWKRLLMLK